MLPKLVTLTHANLKDTQGRHTQIDVAVQQIYAWYYSPGHACTHVLATGGAMLAVLETPEQIRALIQQHVVVDIQTTQAGQKA